MIEILRDSRLYSVELDEDTSQEHLPHKSWGTYRVVDRAKTPDVVHKIFQHLTLHRLFVKPQPHRRSTCDRLQG